MSRRGGLQAKTLAMYSRLDQLSQEWVSTLELADALENEFGRSFGYACKIVNQWARARSESVAMALAGSTPFYCSRPGAALDVGMLCKQYWGTLPVRFRRDRNFEKCPPEEKLHAVLMAYGYLCLGRSDCRAAFNKWATANKQRRIQRTLARDLP